jgi:hypothetical protein
VLYQIKPRVVQTNTSITPPLKPPRKKIHGRSFVGNTSLSFRQRAKLAVEFQSGEAELVNPTAVQLAALFRTPMGEIQRARKEAGVCSKPRNCERALLSAWDKASDETRQAFVRECGPASLWDVLCAVIND